MNDSATKALEQLRTEIFHMMLIDLEGFDEEGKDTSDRLETLLSLTGQLQ